MLTKLFICTDNLEYFHLLKDLFKDSTKIEIQELSEGEFAKNSQFDVIHYYTSLMAPFGVKPTKYESLIVETQNIFDYPNYVVTSPNFEGVINDYTEQEIHLKQIETPLRKVIEFSNTIRKDLTLAIHTDIILPRDKVTMDQLVKVKETIYKVLEEENK